MSLPESVNNIIAVLADGGLILIALSAWLGKVWATRISSNEIHELNKQLEASRNEFRQDLEVTKTELELLKETTLRFQNDKILTYRLAVDVVSKILATFTPRSGHPIQSYTA